MAKNKLDLKVDDSFEVVPAPKPEKQGKPKKQKTQKKENKKFGARIARVFREMISELKKVDWPPFKRTKNNPGVLVNTGTVLIVVLFFLIIITLIDAGLTALLQLLTGV